VPVGFWRCVNHTQNCSSARASSTSWRTPPAPIPIAIAAISSAAHKHADKLLGVLDAAAERAAWGTPLPAGLHRGIALNEAFGTFVAAVCEASVSASGQARMHRIVVALDPGTIVNPLSVETQVQSAVVYGLTATLYGEITIQNGRVEQGNFNDYRMLRMAEMPKVNACSPRAAASVAAAASSLCQWSRRRFATRSSPQPASAFVRCR